MTNEGRKFFGWFYALGLVLIMGIQGCVEVGGGSSSGTGGTSSNDADTTSTSDQTQTQEQE